MGYIPGKTHIEAQAWGRGWIALWAGAGHQRLRHVARNGRAVVFPTEMEAYKAGLAAVQGTEPTVRAETAKPAEHVPTFLNAGQWREDRDERIRVERRQAFRGLGKGFLQVEIKRRRA